MRSKEQVQLLISFFTRAFTLVSCNRLHLFPWTDITSALIACLLLWYCILNILLLRVSVIKSQHHNRIELQKHFQNSRSYLFSENTLIIPRTAGKRLISQSYSRRTIHQWPLANSEDGESLSLNYESIMKQNIFTLPERKLETAATVTHKNICATLN